MILCFANKETEAQKDEMIHPMPHTLRDEACESHPGLPVCKATLLDITRYSLPASKAQSKPPPPGRLPQQF